MKGLPWTEREVSLIKSYLPTIVKQGNGKLVEKTTSFQELCVLLDRRTQAAVAHKTRKVAYEQGLLKTIRQKAHEERATLFHNDTPKEVAPMPIESPYGEVVSVPLRKLYGKVDFETFMSLINE